MTRTKVYVYETNDEVYVRAEAKRRWGLESLKITPRGDRGWPDVIFWVPGGRPVLIEFKRIDDGKRSKRQILIHTFLHRIGYDVQTFDTPAAALSYLGQALQAAKAPG